MKKKVSILLLTAILGVAVVGCGENNASSNDHQSSFVESSKVNTPSSSTSNSVSSSSSSSTSSSGQSQTDYSEIIDNYIDSLMDNTTNMVPYWNKESFKGKWNYIDGVMLNSFMNLYKETNDSKYLDFVKKFVNYYIDSNGDFVKYIKDKDGNVVKTEASGFVIASALDDICESRILFDLYSYTNDSRYLNAINTTFDSVKYSRRTNEGNFWHKESYPNQVWLDGLYMVNPFYLEYANHNQNTSVFVNGNTMSIYDDILNQYKLVRKNMFDEEKKLYYHGYDSSKSIFWANSETGCSKSFWLRSMGWYIVSLADVIEKYPTTLTNNRNELISIFKEALNGVLQYQDEESKMFYQVVDKKDITVYVSDFYLGEGRGRNITNYVETSGSSMISYALMKGYHLGILDKNMYDKGVEIFNGICKNSLTYDENGINLSGICITAGLGPNNSPKRDGSIEYYLSENVGSNDAKGVGPFVMAYIEMKNN